MYYLIEKKGSVKMKMRRRGYLRGYEQFDGDALRNRMDVYYNGYYTFVRKIMSRAGLWPYDDSKRRKLRKSFIVFVLFVSFCVQVSGFLLLPFKKKLFLKFLMRISTNIFGAIFYSLFMYNEQKLKALFDRIRADFQARSTKERKIMQGYAHEAKQNTLVLIYFYIFLMMLLVKPQILLLLKRTSALNETQIRKYPMSMGYYENFQSYYFVILVPVYVILLVEGAVCICACNMYTHLAHHVCAMFRITGHMLENVLDEKKVQIKIDERKTYHALVRVISYHNECIRFVNDINAIFERIFLLQTAFGIVIVCMDIIYFVDVRSTIRDYNELLYYMIFTSSHMFILFSCCHLGQNILDHGVDLYNKTYTFPWYVTPPRIQRMCLLMMAKSAEFPYLSIGKMFRLSYELLIAVLNTSISYAMVFSSR